MTRPGFTIRRVDVPDDVIELPENSEADSELVELRELLDETAGELRKLREAREKLFAEFTVQRDELIGLRAELRRRVIDATIAGLGLGSSELKGD